MIKQVSLANTQGSSDKVYNIQIQEKDSGFVVNFQYGRRGSTLKPGTKTKEPTTLEDAEKIYSKLMKDKIRKGYEPNGDSFEAQELVEVKDIEELPQLLNEVSGEEQVLALLEDGRYVAQEKMDGERRPLKKTKEETFGINKKGHRVSTIKKILNSVSNQDTLLIDCEQVGDVLYAFDCLELNGEDLKNKSLKKRLEVLSSLEFGKNIKIVPTATTTDEKKALFEKLKKENKEGIVFKQNNSKYQSGRPSSGGPVLKYKFYKTTTAKVESHTKGKRSVGLTMLENEEVVNVGKCTIPANHEIPEIGSYVEVRYLYAYKGGALYQPVYLGQRNDQDDTDINTSQLIYKGE